MYLRTSGTANHRTAMAISENPADDMQYRMPS